VGLLPCQASEEPPHDERERCNYRPITPPPPPATTVGAVAAPHRIPSLRLTATALVGLLAAALAYLALVEPPLLAATSGEHVARLTETPLWVAAQRRLANPRATWPLFGATPARTRFVPSGLRPPFRELYRVPGRALIEMPPIVAEGRLVFGTHAGTLHAVHAADGTPLWQIELGGCIASSPAAGPGVVYIGWAGPAPCRRGKDETGGLAAVDARDGNVLWRFRTGNVESSPLLVGDRLFFAAFRSRSDSTVYGLRLHPRRVAWTFRLPTKVASSPALIGRTLFVSAYDRRLYALDAFTGRLRWESSALPQDGPKRVLLGLRSLLRHASWSEAGYYATPAVAYGRIYLGSIDGIFTSFSARTGAHRWSRRLGGAVYGSAAVWNETVYVGASDGRFYAFDSQSGKTRWSRKLPGSILGSPTVTAGNVYISTLNRETFVLDARTGAERWRFPDGQYSPLVHDGQRAFLVGKGRIYAFVNDVRLLTGPPGRTSADATASE
jgi:outer membrane protein assembly factor BamB